VQQGGDQCQPDPPNGPCWQLRYRRDPPLDPQWKTATPLGKMFCQTLSAPGPGPEWQNSPGPLVRRPPPDAHPTSSEVTRRPLPGGWL
jgi:hypothetical protein